MNESPDEWEFLNQLGIEAKFGCNSLCPAPQTGLSPTIVVIKLRLWLAVGCEAKVVAELSSRPSDHFANFRNSLIHFVVSLRLFPQTYTFWRKRARGEYYTDSQSELVQCHMIHM